MTPPPLPDAARPPLSVREPGAVPLLVPHLLGFEPARSLVILGLGDGRQVRMTLRWDVPVDDAFTRDALDCYATALPALTRGGVTAAVLVLFPGVPGCTWDTHVPAGVLPYRGLVDGMADHLAAAGVHVQDVLCVVGGRWSSYLCGDDTCCPPEGRVVDEAAALEAVSELVAAGSAPLRSRAELVEALRPREDGDPFAREVARVVGGVVLRLPTDPMARVEKFVEDVLRWARRPGAGRVPSRLVALGTFLCHGITSRDLLLREMAAELTRPQLHSLRLVLGEAVRCAPGAAAAPPAAVLAVAAYLCGDGAASRVAAERAWDADPAYSLATLVLDMLDAGVPPEEWKAVLSAVDVDDILQAAVRDPRSEPA